MNDSIISYWRDARGGVRGVTALVLTSFLWMQLYPVAAAAKDAIEGKDANAATATTPASFTKGKATSLSIADPQRETMESLSKTLNGMHAVLKKHRDLIVKRKDKKGNLHITITGTKADVDLTAARKEIAQIKQQLMAQDLEAEASFKRDDEHIKAHKLPAVIQQRHDDAVAKYETDRDGFQKGLDVLAQSQDLTTLLSQADVLLKKTSESLPKQAKFDPKNLPFRTADGKVREPATTPEALRKILSAPMANRASVAQRFTLPLEARKQEISHEELAQVNGNGQPFPYPVSREPVMVASIGPMAGLVAMGVVLPTANDLTPTEDVQITPAIQAMATGLHNNPVEIFNWAHDHIEYIPTYGSIQGSDMTLQTKRGNAFDTSSLLIALLRASNIPARYAYGTVDIPIDKVMNWVGGVTDPNAALQLLGQGGIPNIGLAQGGKIFAVRMEHVWVEAFVDAYPSRGAKNLSPSSWIPMDAAFKQYTYAQGMNLTQNVPFDAQSFAQHIQSTSTINPSEGWVQNVDQAYIQNQLSAYQQQVSTYISSQKSNATVGEALGEKIIQPIIVQELPIGLPYHLIVAGIRSSALADSQRYQFTYTLHDGYGSELFAYTASTPALAGKKVALSFKPATQGDADTIASYLPKPHQDGSPIQPSELPQSLPGYLINLVPEFTLDGNVVATGGAVTMGTDLTTEKGYYSPKDGWQTRTKTLVTGEYHAVGLDLQGISPLLLANLTSSLTASKSQMDANALAGLTKHSLTGDIMQAGVLSYFASNDAQDLIAQRSAGVLDVRLPSYGTFQTDLRTTYSYGAPRKVSFPGLLMDIDLIHNAVTAKDNGTQIPTSYVRANGARESAFEHLIPERLFYDPNQTDPNQTAEGVSAIKALTIAASQGQRIYTITQANVDATLPNLTISSDVKNEIRDAAYAGKEITVHQSPISYKGFGGAGYTIIDPQTGAGAYKISSGANGGLISGVASNVLVLASVSGNIAVEMISIYKPILTRVLTNFFKCVEEFVKHNAAILIGIAIILALAAVSRGAGPIVAAVAILAVAFPAAAFNKGKAEGCVDGEFCYNRWEYEDGKCYEFLNSWGARVVAACKVRVADRRGLCMKNGGVPDPNEPPQYNPFVDWPH